MRRAHVDDAARAALDHDVGRPKPNRPEPRRLRDEGCAADWTCLPLVVGFGPCADSSRSCPARPTGHADILLALRATNRTFKDRQRTPIVVASKLDLYGLARIGGLAMAGFEWDPAKAKATAEHGVDSRSPRTCSSTPGADRRARRQRSGRGEVARHRTGGRQGACRGIYASAASDVTRIISARKANKREERAYFGQAAP